MVALFTTPASSPGTKPEEYNATLLARLEAIQCFMSEVGKVDPSGKIIEHVDLGTPEEKKRAARIVGGILGRILRGSGAPSVTAPAETIVSTAATKPLFGLERVLAAIRREIGGSASKATATPPRPAAVAPVKPAPAPKENSIASNLHGLARAECAMREERGLPPLPEHVAMARKNSDQSEK